MTLPRIDTGTTAGSATLVTLLLLSFATGICPAADNSVPRTAVPDERETEEALRVLEELYPSEYARTEPEDRARLAAELLRQAVETVGAPATAYACLCESMRLAAEGGDADTALAAANHLAERFDVDESETRKNALASVARRARSPEAAAMVAEAYLRLAAQERESGKYEWAMTAAGESFGLACRAGKQDLLSRCRRAREELKEVCRLFRLATSAERTLRGRPDDPRASLTLGRFLCLIANDWERGLPLLGQSSDENYRRLAQAELANGKGAEDQAGLGDTWWRLREMEKNEVFRMAMGERSAFWYTSALPDLSGIPKVAVEKRLEQLNAARVAAPGGGGTEQKRHYRDIIKETMKNHPDIWDRIRKKNSVIQMVKSNPEQWRKLLEAEENLSRTDEFDYRLYNELRHLWRPFDLEEAMRYVDVTLEHCTMNEYTINCIASTPEELEEMAQSFPQLKFMVAACWIRIGDLRAAEGKRRVKDSGKYYEKVIAMGDVVGEYVAVANERLSRIE